MEAQQEDKKKNKVKSAFITLISVIILAGVGTVVVTSTLLMNNDNYLGYNSVYDSSQSRFLADTCVEVAINKLKLSTSYTGNETFTLFNGTCQLSIIAGSGNTNRSFTTTGTYKGSVRRNTVVIGTVNPTTVITSWKETP